jgi:hypothetical protein
MEHTIDGDRPVDIFIEDSVREAARQGSAIILIDYCAHLGSTTDSFNAGIDAAQELFSQTRSPLFVPTVRVDEILLGLRCDNQISGHSGC